MKDNQNNKSNRSSDSKSNLKPIQDNQKKHGIVVSDPVPAGKDKAKGLQQDHQPITAAKSAPQNKQISDTPDTSRDETIKGKTTGASNLPAKESKTEKLKIK